jgi:hypothetical protein
MLYVLCLVEGKFYVGLTRRDDFSRVQEHFDGHGCQWTHLYPPVKVLSVMSGQTEEEEDRLTLWIMFCHGWNHVRGGRWSTPILKINPLFSPYIPGSGQFSCFKCQSRAHLSKDCRKNFNPSPFLQCFRCKGHGHFSAQCPNPVRCYKCHGHGHYAGSACPRESQEKD